MGGCRKKILGEDQIYQCRECAYAFRIQVFGLEDPLFCPVCGYQFNSIEVENGKEKYAKVIDRINENEDGTVSVSERKIYR